LFFTVVTGLVSAIFGWMSMTRIQNSGGQLLGFGLSYIATVGFPLMLLDTLAIGLPAYAMNVVEAPSSVSHSTLVLITLAIAFPVSAVVNAPLLYFSWLYLGWNRGSGKNA
jgi:uncharacterized membrane-anchored protein YitT (DUF2179 family)